MAVDVQNVFDQINARIGAVSGSRLTMPEWAMVTTLVEAFNAALAEMQPKPREGYRFVSEYADEL